MGLAMRAMKRSQTLRSERASLAKEGPLTLMLRRIRALLKNQNLRNHPVRGISRRVVWHVRWWLRPREPYLLVSQNSIRLLTLHSGSGALVYYNGVSEPETTEFIKLALRPGMVF